MNDLRKILITKYDAIVAVKKYLDDENRIQGQEPIERHNRWRAEAILEDVPSIDAPEDWGRYSERLWQIAYERGKADRPQGEWIYIDEPIIGNPYGRYKCSKCNLEEPFESDFCPHCGARMKGADDYERAIEQMEHDMLYEPTYNSEDGSM